MRKKLKDGNCYIIVNCDEPYIEEIFKELVKGEKPYKHDGWKESTDFKTWFKDTFGLTYETYVADRGMTTKAKAIVSDLLYDLTDRKGLKQEWNSIDKPVQEDIKSAWVDIIVKNLRKGESDEH